MSFSKAKIQRFNEVGSEAPPPGAYDPKFDTKVKGPVIEKKERFHDNRSVTSGSTECNFSTSSKGLTSPAASFKMPQVPKKKMTPKPLTPKSTTPTSKSGKSKPSSVVKDLKVKYEINQEISDLKVECSNKDKTIQEQEKHIDEMKEQMSKLEKQLEELQKKQADTEDEHKKDIETMAAMQQEILLDHDEKHRMEMELLRTQFNEMSNDKEREIEMRKRIEDELKKRIQELLNKITDLEIDLANAKNDDCLSEKMKKMELETQYKEEQFSRNMAETKSSYEQEIRCLEEQITKKEIELGKSQQEVQILVAQLEEIRLNTKNANENFADNEMLTEIYLDELNNENINLKTKLEMKENIILNLQVELSNVQCELDELKVKYEELLQETDTKINELKLKHRDEVMALKNDFSEDIKALQNFIQTDKAMRSRLQTLETELEKTNNVNKCMIKKHRDDIEALQNSHEQEKIKLKLQWENSRVEYLREIEHLNITREKEIAALNDSYAQKIEEENKKVKEHTIKIVQNAEVVTRETLAACRAESEERMKRVIAEHDVKVDVMVKEARTAVEEELRITNERYKSRLAQIEIEKVALTEDLAQKDVEIGRLTEAVEELRSSVETQESFGQSLQTELDKVEAELAEKKEELKALKDQMRSEAAEMVSRRRRFEIIMIENQASVAALSQRLAQSHAEIERLQNQLKRNENFMNEHRDLINTMCNNSQLVQEKLHTLMNQSKAKQELIDLLEGDTMNEIQSLKLFFEEKLENLKEAAINEILRLQNENSEKTKKNSEIKTQLNEMGTRLSEVQSLLLQLEERNDSQAIEISKLELTNRKLEKRLKDELEISEEKLKIQDTEYQTALDEANSRVNDLKVTVKALEQRDKRTEECAILREQEKIKWKEMEKSILEDLRKECMKREEIESKMKTLVDSNEKLMRDYKDISDKYAEIIGHQNHKQKIKHIAQLKEKISRLEQELQLKIRLNEQQQKVIEKMKIEDKRSYSKGKENVLGVSKSNNTTPVSSPHKPLTPLRNRNE